MSNANFCIQKVVLKAYLHAPKRALFSRYKLYGLRLSLGKEKYHKLLDRSLDVSKISKSLESTYRKLSIIPPQLTFSQTVLGLGLGYDSRPGS